MHNIDKILHYISFFAKYPIEVDNKTIYRKRKGIRLANTFFHTDGCIQCGRCCIGEDHVYVEHEWQNIIKCPQSEFDNENLPIFRLNELRSNTYAEPHEINGKTVHVYVHKCPKTEMFIPAKGKIKQTCNWMFEQNGLYRCGIHPVVSMTCDIPHMKMFHSKEGSVSIATSQYGRNWAMECPITFRPPKDKDEFEDIKQRRMNKLKRIHDCAVDLNINETYVPEVIEYIKSIPYEYYPDALGYDFIRIIDDNCSQVIHTFVPKKHTIKLQMQHI